jgi:hypothetical protein
LVEFLGSDRDTNDFTFEQNLLLSRQSVTFILGTHFNCPPHFWDDMPPDRVLLDYAFVIATKTEEKKMMEKAEKDAKRYNAGGNRNKGRPVRTTSDSSELGDFFERTNQDLRD